MVLMLGLVAAAAWSRRRLALHEGLLLVGFGYLALFGTRNTPLYAIVAVPVLARQLTALPPVRGRLAPAFRPVAGWLGARSRLLDEVDCGASRLAWPSIALGVLIAVSAAQLRAGVAPLGAQWDPSRQPVAATAYLKAHAPSGKMFNQMEWGGYLLQELWPEHRVFFDGWVDFYGEPLTREYMRVVRLEPGWRDVLAARDVGWVVVRADSSLAAELERAPDWQLRYRDDLAVILARA
jgi:hypothetical protein